MTQTAQDSLQGRETLANRYREVRAHTECICAPLQTEDFVVQSMPDVSPVRWHLAHTTWFFETMVLAAEVKEYRWHDPAFCTLFNSYYNSIGLQFPRARRGLLTRPTVEEVFEYRQEIDRRMEQFLLQCPEEAWERVAYVVELGLHHEQQHGELILTDIKHVLSCNPMYPAYAECNFTPKASDVIPTPKMQWHDGPSGVCWIGHQGDGFAYDNESPRHQQFVAQHQLAGRLVTNAEYLAFMDDKGYQRPELWLSLGWQTVCEETWQTPLYWVRQADTWHEFTLDGLQPIDPQQPVCHISYFEADAFARWAGARLPTEAEWEVNAAQIPISGNFAQQQAFHPTRVDHSDDTNHPLQIFGDLWEWTSSSYSPYPGYRPPPGAQGEYNGKFMCNQYVLRGGSCATSESHIRSTYRNFFPPEARWQFTGIRLAR